MAKGERAVRTRILDAALELLRTRGVKSLAQPQVARAAGVLQSHLTYYFPKRTDLLLAVAKHSVESVTRELQAFFASQAVPTPGADARAQVLELVRATTKDRARTRILLGLMVEADDDPALRAVMIENVGVLRGVIALGLRRDLDDPDVDLVIAALWGLGLEHYLLGEHRGEAFTDRVVDRLGLWVDRLPER